MPRKTPPDRRNAILAAAREEFAAKGYAAARLDDVAARVGISKATLYLQFKDKSALFQALIDNLLLSNLPSLDMPSFQGMQADAQLRTLIQHGIITLASGDVSFLPRLVIGEGSNFPEIAKAYHDRAIGSVLGILIAIISRGVADGTFRPVDPALAARSVAGGVLLTAIWRTVFEPVGAEPIDLDAMASAHADVLLNGLRHRQGEP